MVIALIVILFIVLVALLCWGARNPSTLPTSRALTGTAYRQLQLSVGGKYIGDTTSNAEPGSRTLALVDAPFTWLIYPTLEGTWLGHDYINSGTISYVGILTGDSTGLYVWNPITNPRQPSTLAVTLPPGSGTVTGQVYFTDSNTGTRYYIIAPTGNTFVTTDTLSNLPGENITVTYL